MRNWIQRLRDACLLIQLVLIAGGGVAFFVFARMLFDRTGAFSPHPRYDAGEIVGPLVGILNFVHNVFGLTMLMAIVARSFEPGIQRKPNQWLAYVAFAILIISVVERFLLIPGIVDLRAQIGREGFDGDVVTDQRRKFGMLHGIDSLVHVAIVLLAWAGIFLDRAARKFTVQVRA
ncbi:MAG: hypothetical protein HY286_13840 [Planctomycetes bacterium]|nr:hypothetical protein [Planctomycetota bacterium]